MDDELKKLQRENTTLAEKLVRIYRAYFDVVEFGVDHQAALEETIEESMGIDMKIILDLANKRGARNAL